MNTTVTTELAYNAKVKVRTKFYKTTLPADMIFTKKDVSTIKMGNHIYFANAI